jgi:hypothetical protein
MWRDCYPKLRGRIGLLVHLVCTLLYPLHAITTYDTSVGSWTRNHSLLNCTHFSNTTRQYLFAWAERDIKGCLLEDLVIDQTVEDKTKLCRAEMLPFAIGPPPHHKHPLSRPLRV